MQRTLEINIGGEVFVCVAQIRPQKTFPRANLGTPYEKPNSAVTFDDCAMHSGALAV